MEWVTVLWENILLSAAFVYHSDYYFFFLIILVHILWSAYGHNREWLNPNITIKYSGCTNYFDAEVLQLFYNQVFFIRIRMSSFLYVLDVPSANFAQKQKNRQTKEYK